MSKPENAAPTHLGKRAKHFFQSIVADFEFEDHHVEILTEAANALDRAERCRLQIAKAGETFVDRWGQLRPHPLLAAERDSRALFARLLRELGLDIVAPDHKGR